MNNKNNAKSQPWYKALKRTLKQYTSETVGMGDALNRIAHKVIELALQGDRYAIEEIGNRMDGKAGSGPGEGQGGITILIQNYSEQDILKPARMMVETESIS